MLSSQKQAVALLLPPVAHTRPATCMQKFQSSLRRHTGRWKMNRAEKPQKAHSIPNRVLYPSPGLSDTGRRTEQTKANLDPRVGLRVGPRVAPRVGPRERPRGLISLFSAIQGLPRKLPQNVPRRRPRKCPRKCPVKWSRFTCPVFTCSVRRTDTFATPQLLFVRGSG